MTTRSILLVLLLLFILSTNVIAFPKLVYGVGNPEVQARSPNRARRKYHPNPIYKAPSQAKRPVANPTEPFPKSPKQSTSSRDTSSTSSHTWSHTHSGTSSSTSSKTSSASSSKSKSIVSTSTTSSNAARTSSSVTPGTGARTTSSTPSRSTISTGSTSTLTSTSSSVSTSSPLIKSDNPSSSTPRPNTGSRTTSSAGSDAATASHRGSTPVTTSTRTTNSRTTTLNTTNSATLGSVAANPLTTSQFSTNSNIPDSKTTNSSPTSSRSTNPSHSYSIPPSSITTPSISSSWSAPGLIPQSPIGTSSADTGNSLSEPHNAGIPVTTSPIASTPLSASPTPTRTVATSFNTPGSVHNDPDTGSSTSTKGSRFESPGASNLVPNTSSIGPSSISSGMVASTPVTRSQETRSQSKANTIQSDIVTTSNLAAGGNNMGSDSPSNPTSVIPGPSSPSIPTFSMTNQQDSPSPSTSMFLPSSEESFLYSPISEITPSNAPPSQPVQVPPITDSENRNTATKASNPYIPVAQPTLPGSEVDSTSPSSSSKFYRPQPQSNPKTSVPTFSPAPEPSEPPSNIEPRPTTPPVATQPDSSIVGTQEQPPPTQDGAQSLHTAPLSGLNNIAVSVGDHGKQVSNILLDTGSSLTWFNSFDLAEKKVVPESQDTSDTFNIGYFGSPFGVGGNYAQADVTVANIHIPNMRYGLAKTNNPSTRNIGGIIGLSRDAKTIEGPTFVKQMKDKLQHQVIGFRGAGTMGDGGVTFGGVNANDYSGSLVYSQAIDTATTWDINLQEIFVGTEGLGLRAQISLDTGTLGMYVPHATALKIHEALGGGFSAPHDAFFAPCNDPNNPDDLKRLSFLVAGQTYDIAPATYLADELDNGGGFCRTSIRNGTDSSVWLVGSTLLHNVYAAFDWDQNRIGLARLADPKCGSVNS